MWVENVVGLGMLLIGAVVVLVVLMDALPG